MEKGEDYNLLSGKLSFLVFDKVQQSPHQSTPRHDASGARSIDIPV